MKPRILIPIGIIILVITVVVFDAQRRNGVFGTKKGPVTIGQMLGKDPNAVDNQKRATEIIAKVRTHMEIDAAEEATVATIVDVKKLRLENPFYNRAENGDFLVVTPTRAILYNEKSDRILDVAPLQNQKDTSSTKGG